MIKAGGGFSLDNGRTWAARPVNPDFDRALPHGYRREPFPLFVDPANGKIIQLVPSLDTPGLDPRIVEPPIALEAYYLRYRVSIDGGRTFLFDEPVVQKGKTAENPFDGVYRGKNGIFMGDVGSQIIRTRAGQIIIPAQACKLGPDGKLSNPGGGWTYTDVILILGSWRADNRLEWAISQPIEGDPSPIDAGNDRADPGRDARRKVVVRDARQQRRQQGPGLADSELQVVCRFRRRRPPLDQAATVDL